MCWEGVNEVGGAVESLLVRLRGIAVEVEAADSVGD